MQNPLWGTGNLEILIYHLRVQELPSRLNCFIYHHQLTPRPTLSPGAELALVPKAQQAPQLPQQLVKAKNATKGPGSSNKKIFIRKLTGDLHLSYPNNYNAFHGNSRGPISRQLHPKAPLKDHCLLTKWRKLETRGQRH